MLYRTRCSTFSRKLFLLPILVLSVLIVQGQNNNQGQGKGGPQLWSLTGNPIDSGDFLGTTSAMPIIFKTDATERMRLLLDGRFGVGTNTPQYLLDVNGRFRAQDSSFLSSTFVQGPFYLQDGSQASGRVLTSDADGQGAWKAKDSVNFWSKSGNDLYYDGGNVGIGTSSPGELFEVDGNARIQGTTTMDSLRVNGRTEFGYATFDSLKVGDSSIVIAGSTQGSNPNSNLITAETPENLQLQETETPSNNHTGNVGISTGNPGKKLHVKVAHDIGQVENPGDLLGHHAGIRLENEVESPQGNLESVAWDLEPLVTGNGYSEFRIGIHGNPWIMKMEDDREITLRDELRVGGFQESSIRLLPSPNALVGFQMRVENNNSGLNDGLSNVMNLYATSTNVAEPDAIALSMDREETRSIVLRKSGNVGIGTKDPDEKLQILGDGAKLRVGEANNNIRMGYNGANAVLDNFGDGVLLINWYSGKNVAIGSPSSGPGGNADLTVHGKVRSCEVIVDADSWCDHVFHPGYQLPSLEEEQAHIEKYGHLKDVPSEEEILKEGMALGDLTKVQQQKVEELYLHLFELVDKVEELEKERERGREKDHKRKGRMIEKERIKMLKVQNEKLREVVEELKEQNKMLRKNEK